MFRRSDVPLEKDASARFLPWLIGFMVFLAALALTAANAVTNLADRWDTGLTGRMTVQVPPPPGAANGVDAANRVQAVLDVLRSRAGVERAQPVSRERMQQMLRPWLGDSTEGADLPLPRLISVVVDPDAGVTAARLEEAISPAVPDAIVDDHDQALGRFLDVVWTVKMLALLVLGLVAAAAVITVIFVTRTGLAVHRQVIELLHLIGAHDSYVAAQFQRHAMRLGLLGGVIGLALALVTLLLLSQIIGVPDSAVVPKVDLHIWQWALLLLLPAITAGIATLTARVTVLRTLARMA
jgi:cell division transport system permease protein